MPHYLIPLIATGFMSSSGILVWYGVVLIRRGERLRHRAVMLTATAFASIFFALYLVNVSLNWVTPFEGPAWARRLYLGLIYPHSLLATLLIPLGILTLRRAHLGQFRLHKQVARWTARTWWVVAASGLLVYWMLYSWNPQ